MKSKTAISLAILPAILAGWASLAWPQPSFCEPPIFPVPAQSTDKAPSIPLGSGPGLPLPPQEQLGSPSSQLRIISAPVLSPNRMELPPLSAPLGNSRPDRAHHRRPARRVLWAVVRKQLSAWNGLVRPPAVWVNRSTWLSLSRIPRTWPCPRLPSAPRFPGG